MMLQATFHRYVIYKSKSGKVSRRILTFMPDKSYISKYGMDASKNGVNHLEKTFSGYVEYNDSGYRPLFVYRVKDGKVLQRVNLRKGVESVSRKKNGVGVSSYCEHCDPEYEMVCEGVADPDATGGTSFECTEEVVGFSCYEVPCSGDGGGGGDYPDDCSNPNNADLPECSFEDEDDCEYYGTCDDGGGNDCGYSVNSKGMRVKNNCGELNLNFIIPFAGEKINPTKETKCFDKTQEASLTIFVQQPNENTRDMIGLNSVGHVFIGISQNGINRFFGFYPNSPAAAVFGSQSSEIHDNSGELYHVSISKSITPAQLTDVINYVNHYPSNYSLSTYNCTDFGLGVANKGGLSLPATTGSTNYIGMNFSGRNPGDLGQDIRNLNLPSGVTRSTVSSHAPQKTGVCP